MTPSMGMAAPKGVAPQAGLAALAQPAKAPQGKSPENMGAMMAIARKMSDAQLAQVLQGKSLDVPQYVAMTEAMGRKQLRTAVEGAQAAQHQPSLKDKLVGEYEQAQQAQAMPQGGGVASIPAPNMAPQGMAAGGIVAFDGGGTAYDPNELSIPAPSGVDKRIWEAIKDKFSEWNQPWAPPKGTPEEIRGLRGGRLPAGALEKETGAPHPSNIPAPTAEQTAAFMGDLSSTPTIVAAPPVQTKKSGLEEIVKAQTKSGPTSYEEAKKDNMQDYLSKLEGLSAKQREGLAQLRKESGGEALMQLAAGILSRPNLQQGLAAGLPLVASTAAASRKEQRDVEKNASEYDLNLAKARAALQEGDKDRALKYQQLADENRYRMGMLNKPDSGIAMLNALKNPENMEIFKEMYAAKSPTDKFTLAAATTAFNKIIDDPFSKEAKRLKELGITSPSAYQQYVLNNSGTMDSNPFIAERQRRGI